MSTLKDSLRNSLSRAVFLGFSMLSTFLVARLMSPDDFGIFNLVGYILLFSSNLVFPGILVSVLYFFPKKNEKEIFNSSFFLVFSGAVFVAGLLFLIAPLISAYYLNPSLTFLLRVFSVEVVLIVLYNFFTVFFKAEGRFDKSAIVSSLFGFFRMFSVLFLLLGLGVFGAYSGKILSYAIVISLSVFFLRKLFSLKVNFKIVKDLLKHQLPFYLSGFLSSFSFLFIPIFLGKFSMSDVAFFSLAFSLCNLPVVVFSAFYEVFMQRFFAKPDDAFLRRTTKYSAYVAGYFLLMYLIFGEYLLNIFFSGKYANVLPSLVILSFWMFVSAVSGNIPISLIGKGRSLQYNKFKVVQDSSAIVMSLFLVPRMLSAGAAVSLLVSASLYLVLHFFFRKKYEIHIGWRYIFLTMFASSVSIGLSRLVSLVLPTIFSLFAVPLVSLVGYVSILVMFRGFDRDDLKLAGKIFHVGHF